jgi:outer membrane lipoprotein-sorting protein
LLRAAFLVRKTPASAQASMLCATITPISKNVGASFPPQGSSLKSVLSLVVAAGLCTLAWVLQSRASASQEGSRWTTESLLNRMDKAASDFHSLTADIEHIKYTDVVKDTSTENGQIFVRRDQKMRIEFNKPDPRVILRTGDSLFVYTPKINRVEEYNLGKNRALVDQYVLLGFGTKSQNMQKSYDIVLTGEEEIDQHKTFLLALAPKSEDVRKQITKIQMWIDSSSWLPVQQKFFEAGSGDYFIFKYSNMMKNLKIADSKFKPDWPKNAARIKPRQ